MASKIETYTVNDHFTDKDPAVRKTYDALLKAIRKFGPVIEEAKKTSIHVVNSSALAGVATRKSYLILTIKANHSIKSKRVHKSEKVSASRYHHEIKLASSDEVDAELIGWLKEAYKLSG